MVRRARPARPRLAPSAGCWTGTASFRASTQTASCEQAGYRVHFDAPELPLERSWLDRDGRPAHHLLDPASGRPAFTGLVQVTALAPSALEAEALSKAALLSGPGAGQAWLSHGGLVVYEDGQFEVLDPPSN